MKLENIIAKRKNKTVYREDVSCANGQIRILIDKNTASAVLLLFDSTAQIPNVSR